MLTKITVKLTRVVCCGGEQWQRGGEGVGDNGKHIGMKLNRLGFQAQSAIDDK